MQQAMIDLNKVIELSPNDKVAITDKECLGAIRLGSLGKLGDNHIFDKAIAILTKLISFDSNQKLNAFNINSQVMQTHNQPLPKLKKQKKSPQRNSKDKGKGGTKIGVVHNTYNGERVITLPETQILGGGDENTIFTINPDEEIEKSLFDDDEQDEDNLYKENIFSKEDFFLYRGTMHFYNAEFDKALIVPIYIYIYIYI